MTGGNCLQLQLIWMHIQHAGEILVSKYHQAHLREQAWATVCMSLVELMILSSVKQIQKLERKVSTYNGLCPTCIGDLWSYGKGYWELHTMTGLLRRQDRGHKERRWSAWFLRRPWFWKHRKECRKECSKGDLSQGDSYCKFGRNWCL